MGVKKYFKLFLFLCCNIKSLFIFEEQTQKNMTTTSNYRYRIISEEGKIRFTGTEMGSWFTLEMARKLAGEGDMIYEYDANGERLWEVI